MSSVNKDLDILERFAFEVQPVGVKFLVKEPDMNRLGEQLTFCEMLKRAQQGDAFYAGADNHRCGAGLYVLGQEDVPEPFINGEYGAGLGIYDGTRSASRLYLHIPKINKGVVNYVAFSPLDKLEFQPDLLIMFSKTDQTEIILRAVTYKTGDVLMSRTTSAIGCAWIYAFPFLKGEVNYMMTGLGHGMKRRKLFPEGYQIISIPYDKLSLFLESLKEMQWELPAFKPDGMDFVRQLHTELGLEPPK
jgi:uncharacterized protein (DUF169 family)